MSPSFTYLCTSSIIKKSLTNKWKCILFRKSLGQKAAATQYGDTKIALKEDSDARKCLIAFRMRKMGWTSRLFSLDQSDENTFKVSVFGHRNFELILSLPQVWQSIFTNSRVMYQSSQSISLLSLWASLLLSRGMQNISKFILLAKQVLNISIAKLCK